VELSDYVLELLREDEEFILYRGHARCADAAPVLLLVPASTHPAPETLKIEHEFSFWSELDPIQLGSPASRLIPLRGAVGTGAREPGGARDNQCQGRVVSAHNIGERSSKDSN
jgi:hypothetical protein